MATWDNIEKVGEAWDLNELELQLNQDTDPDTGSEVSLNMFGVENTWTNISK